MALTLGDVKKVAKLANLPLAEDQEQSFAKQLAEVLDYAELLKKVDTKKVKPTFNVTNKVIEITDEAEPEPELSLTVTEALQNANQTTDGYFVTKGVFEEN